MRNVRLTPQTFLQGLVAVLLVVNLLVGLGAALGRHANNGSSQPTSSEDLAALDQQFKALETKVQELQQTTPVGAEERVTSYVRTAHQRGISLVSLTSTQRRDRFGSQELLVFASFLEFRGPRDELITFLRDAPNFFQGNVLISNVEASGAADPWSIRFTLSQVLQA